MRTTPGAAYGKRFVLSEQTPTSGSAYTSDVSDLVGLGVGSYGGGGVDDTFGTETYEETSIEIPVSNLVTPEKDGSSA